MSTATLNPTGATRDEKDSLGVRQVPADAYYGVQALRGHENFPISGVTAPVAYPEAIRAYGWIKKATAQTNGHLGLIPQDMADAIATAAQEMIDGKFNDQFIVDVYQGGTGTSHHMNVNEILANRATELMGGNKGEYTVNPNDHVNYGQSTNDVTPTMMRLTFLSMHAPLVASLKQFQASLLAKSVEFKDVLIAGRTHMQDAVPLTMGQQFGAYAHAMQDAIDNVEHAAKRLYQIGLGASALGTGLNTHPQYRPVVTEKLAAISGLPLVMHPDYFQATSSFGHFADYSAALRSVAIELEKTAHDLKLYSMGPKTGLGELLLPSKQPGSSIMPGKINPIYPELMDQMSYIVQGNDLTIALCAQNGQLQLNVMMPTILLKMVESQRILTNSFKLFAAECIDGLKVDEAVAKHRIETSCVLLTALNPHIGYAAAADIAKKVLSEGKPVSDVALAMNLTDKLTGQPIDAQRLAEILAVEKMTSPN
ncbi:MAG: aspartate ammonia-lyase [Vampirovibrionales bacterium]